MIDFLTIFKLIREGFTGSNKKPSPPVDPVTPEDSPTEPIEPTKPVDDYSPAAVIVRALKRLGHEVFEDNSKPYNLNIVGIRDTSPEFDKYNCRFAQFWKDENGDWRYLELPFSTYPGEYYTVQRHLNPKGVLIMANGQYKGAYRLRNHRGIYPALCQDLGQVKIHRDGNRNRIYDLDPRSVYTGSYGANIHCAENPDDGITRDRWEKIAKSSAGCQVIPDVQGFIEARKEWYQAVKHWGNSFTYTLINDTDLKEAGEPTEITGTRAKESPELWRPVGENS
jgi:hypothetical protein